MKTTNYSDLRQNLAAYLEQANQDDEPLIVTRRGGKPVVLLSLAAYSAHEAHKNQASNQLSEQVSSYDSVPPVIPEQADALRHLDARIARSLAQAEAGFLIPAEEVFASIGVKWRDA